MFKILILSIMLIGLSTANNPDIDYGHYESETEKVNCEFLTYAKVGTENMANAPLLYNFFNIIDAPPMCLFDCDMEFCCSIRIIRSPDLESPD